MIKRIITVLAVTLLSVSILNVIVPSGNLSAMTMIECSDRLRGTSFFEIPAWYRGLGSCEPVTPGSSDYEYKMDNLKDKGPNEIIFKVALNIIDMALRIVAILAIIFIIYGGVLLITAQGAPDKVKSGKLAITQALIGMAIAMLASSVIGFIVSAMGSSGVDPVTGLPIGLNAEQLYDNVLNLIFFGCGIVSVIIIILSGYRYSMAAGNPESTKKATQTIIWACVGLAVVILATAIKNFVLDRVS